MMVVEASTVATGLSDGELLWMRTRVKESWIDFGAVAGKCDCSLFNSAMAREKKMCRRNKTKLLYTHSERPLISFLFKTQNR